MTEQDELKILRETNRRLNRRCQAAESELAAASRYLRNEGKQLIKSTEEMRKRSRLLGDKLQVAHRDLFSPARLDLATNLKREQSMYMSRFTTIVHLADKLAFMELHPDVASILSQIKAQAQYDI